jgi:hypothetical protein
MREVNFSIPSMNKASVGITTALYDRRALDCTSTLPLINSLNHLAYLTTSSARIRDILTIDGGIERLVVILKEGRSKDLMSMWKWNLAFQCVVNVGVRGSENVRTRVVEADMVPVIATILDNYIRVMERIHKRNAAVAYSARARESRSSSLTVRRSTTPHATEVSSVPNTHGGQADVRGHASQASRQQAHGRHHHYAHHHHHHHHHENRQIFPPYNVPREPTGLQPVPTMNAATAGEFGLQPVRDVDRLPSMASVGGPSQPASPTTPPATVTVDRVAPRVTRPPIRHQRSMSGGESDDGNSDEMGPQPPAINRDEPIVDIQSGGDMERDSMLHPADEPMGLALPESQAEAETFNITHRSPINGSRVNPAGPVPPVMGLSANQPTAVNPPPLTMSSRYSADGPASLVPCSMPREEDVLMSLQLLAYVSKYCNLRSYFQNSHLVPRLSIDRELRILDENSKGRHTHAKQEEIEEYLLPDDFNIFPLVEKFTVRHHPLDMQYWAGVVMRNLCRKDESKGGIRQCAYYECGKWEEYQRQFAKCRRCRRTKYCSKECQKSAWVYHRHWCVAAQS